MEKNNFDYDNISDSLIISRKEKNEKVQGSAEIGNLVLDFTDNGELVNVEIQHISKFLEIIDINPNILNELIGVDLIVQKQKGAVFLFAVLKTPVTKKSLPLATVPITELASSI